MARKSSVEVGTEFATLEAAALTVDCVDAAALLADCPRVLLSGVGIESGAAERALGVTASGPGEPYEGAGEPYAGGASLPRC